MANLITHSLSFNKESISEYFLKPLFIENDIRDLVDIRLDIKSGEKLDFVDKLEKITKAYAQGSSFTSSTGVTLTQKTLSVSDMKAEVRQNGKAFLNQVKQAALKKGYSENDISETLFQEIVLSIFMDGLKADLQRQVWFGDTLMENRTSDITIGTPNLDYNEYTGFWSRIISEFDAVTIPAAQLVAINSTTYLDAAAVAEVDTITITGTSGTCNLTLNGTASNTTMGAIKTDGAKAALKACYAAMPPVLRKNKMNARFMVTATVADNYRDSLETGAHDGAQMKLVNGVEQLMFRGIPVVEMLDWDERISDDLGNCRPHRILLTIPKNLVVGHDGMMDDGDIEAFYDQDSQNNVFRVEYKIGTQLIHPDYIVASY